jgi:hypothetical protein
MDQPGRKTPTAAGRRPLALCGAALFVGLALYTSRPSLPAPAEGPKEPQPAAPTPAAVAAANKFLGSLDARQREKALYDFGSPRKPAWSNLPVTLVPRNGVALGDLTKEQRALALDVLAAVLSKDGYQKALDIMEGDQKLAEGQGERGRAMFGADRYYLAIFGKPSETEAWMVQFGGHHLGLNVTVVGRHFVLTPTHTGAQPALFKRGDREVRPLGPENDAGFRLVSALDEKQRKQAVIAERPQGELLLGPGRDGRQPPAPEGVKGSALTAEQRGMLLDLIAAWVNIVEPGAAKARLEEIKKDVGETYFAWKGPTARGSAVYFRVQGPTVWIEYAPQGGADHIHTVVRNPADDYGAALTKGKE